MGRVHRVIEWLSRRTIQPKRRRPPGPDVCPGCGRPPYPAGTCPHCGLSVPDLPPEPLFTKANAPKIAFVALFLGVLAAAILTSMLG